jgi:hypothetical protein
MDAPGDEQVIAAGIDAHPELVTLVDYVEIGLGRDQDLALRGTQVNLVDRPVG